MTLYRARPCPICGKPVALTREGRIRAHRDTRPRTGPAPANPACAGNGRLPDTHQTGTQVTDSKTAAHHAAPGPDPREDAIHRALHDLGVRIPNLKVEGCHCNLITQVVLDAIGRNDAQDPTR